MADFKFKVAYTDDSSKINPAIAAGIINEGDLIIINEDGKGSMKFITDQQEVIGMDATLNETQTQDIINAVVAEVGDEFVTTSSTLILNGNTPLEEETYG